MATTMATLSAMALAKGPRQKTQTDLANMAIARSSAVAVGAQQLHQEDQQQLQKQQGSVLPPMASSSVSTSTPVADHHHIHHTHHHSHHHSSSSSSSSSHNNHHHRHLHQSSSASISSNTSTPRIQPPMSWTGLDRSGKPIEIIVISDDEDEDEDEDKQNIKGRPSGSSGSFNVDVPADDDNNDDDDDEVICTGSHPSTYPSLSSTSISSASYGSTSSACSSSSTSSYTSYSALDHPIPTTSTSYSSSSSSTSHKRKRSRLSPTPPAAASATSPSSSINPEKSRANRKRQRLISEIKYYPPSQPVIKYNDIHIPEFNDSPRGSSACTQDKDGYFNAACPTSIVNGRFHLSKVLGQGTFGKVFAAYDTKNRRHCALKIIRAIPKYRDASKIELRVLSTIVRYDSNNRNRCIHVREAFSYNGHVCILTDLLSLSIYDFMKLNHFWSFPPSHVQSFARQILTSVAFLHDLGLVHTDLKPENILLKSSDNVPRTHPKTAPQNEKYLTLKDTAISLIDFGSAIFNDEYHNNIVSTRHYRAPEIILGVGWSFPCDVWSIGCIIVELCTGEALFQTHENCEHLALMEKILGRSIDRSLLSLASRNQTGVVLINPKTGRINFPNQTTEKNSIKVVNETRTLATILRRKAMPTMQTADERYWHLLKDLLAQIFTYDPAKRITARDALSHPWLTYDIDNDNYLYDE
ncbi:uncharacterized protein SAPINGB_P004095 [Magnusiomyces paraingens]|uniref:Protein kinase domain-containing protein n=1 Tax=Magnusiomyces paraingens TaxID=2606893 RepID=A0A5E8BY61_9ASCO|nr:uncharacterized protein SAPINGB_P004095 [Saprochaete ingens]VVT54477.1 unnamed protein product [Saprochaete ingens]